MPTPFIRKLEAFGPLPDEDRRSLEQPLESTRWVDANRDLVREGDRPAACQLIVEGFAYRHRTMGDGRRQIMSFEIAGDLCDLHGVLLGEADHSITTLTPCTVAPIPHSTLTEWTRAVQRCWMGCIEPALPHLRGEVRRLIARGIPEPANV